MFNKVIMQGNLTKDPELKYTPTGTPVCNFRIANNTRFSKDREETLYIDIVSFGKSAETYGAYLKKGSSIIVDGRLQEQRWEKDGKQFSRMEIVANQIEFLSKKDNGSVPAPQGSSPAQTDIDDVLSQDPF